MSASIWVGYPRSYTPGRARRIQYVTLHYTAGSEGPTSAENGAVYDKRRTDGTSCHYFTDSVGKALQEVPDGDRSHSARWHGNEIGIHIEICGTRQTRAQWLDDTSLATLKTTAALVRELCERHNLAMKRLSVAQTRAAYYASPSKRPTGINDHAAVTLAYPEDQGDHMDVGEAFPWDVFMKLVLEGEEMPLSDAEIQKIADRTVETLLKKNLPIPQIWKDAFPDDPSIQDGEIGYDTCVRSGYFHARQANDQTKPPAEPPVVDPPPTG